jgi:nucleotide-binding universal stress UspA family protein
MNVLCAIGTQGGSEIVSRVFEVIGSRHDLHLLHVIDTGPRHTMQEYLYGPGGLHRSRPPGHERPIDAAEQAAANAVINEARAAAERAGFTVHSDVQQGRPEQVISRAAHLLGCQLIAIQSSEGMQGRPQIGPESVGHTARFVLDHAPCNVLLLREPLSRSDANE